MPEITKERHRSVCCTDAEAGYRGRTLLTCCKNMAQESERADCTQQEAPRPRAWRSRHSPAAQHAGFKCAFPGEVGGFQSRGPRCGTLRYLAHVRQIIIPNWREHFNGHRVFEDVRVVFYPSGNAPAVARLRLVFLGANREPNAALDQVAGLLMRMGMARQDRALAQPKLGHQGFATVNQRLPFNPGQGRTVSFVVSHLEHS